MVKLLHGMTMEKRRRLTGIVFILPWIIGFLLFFAKPVILTIIYTFSKITLTTSGMKTRFVGLNNYYATFMEDPKNARMIINSLGNVLYEVLIIAIFSIFIAMLLNQKFRGRAIARTIFILPIIISSGVLIVVLKEDLFSQSVNSGQAGTIYQSSELLGMMLQMGIDNGIVTFFTGVINRIFDLVWKSGVQIIIFLSALQSIPPSLYEASDVEGATPWQTFWEITFPMISPFILVNVIYSVIDSFTFFDNTVMRKVYDAVNDLQFETSSTLSLSYFLVVLVVVGIITAILSKKVYYMDH